MKVLVACEFSGIVREAFKKYGHDAWSCDLLDTEIPGQHIKGDVRKILNEGWDLMIAHPPCTFIANSGVQYLHKDKIRWIKLKEAKEFFMTLYSANIDKICIENPVPHKYAKLPAYNQIVQPYYFGESKSKITCLWLKNLPLLKPTNIVSKGEFYMCGNGGTNPKWYSTSSKNRSRTFPGLAHAMANQWS